MSLSEQKQNDFENVDKETETQSKNNSDGQNLSDKRRAVFSMALSVVLTSIMIQITSLLSGFVVGVALWFVFAFIISKTFILLGWGRNENEENKLSDVEILEQAYKRDLINEAQLEDSLEDSL